MIDWLTKQIPEEYMTHFLYNHYCVIMMYIGKNNSNSHLSLFYIFPILWCNNFHSSCLIEHTTIKYRNIVIDIGNGVKTNTQFTYLAIRGGNGHFLVFCL